MHNLHENCIIIILGVYPSYCNTSDTFFYVKTSKKNRTLPVTQRVKAVLPYEDRNTRNCLVLTAVTDDVSMSKELPTLQTLH